MEELSSKKTEETQSFLPTKERNYNDKEQKQKIEKRNV